MRNAIACGILCCALHGVGQGTQAGLAERHTRIPDLYEQEEYAGVIALVDQQLREATEAPWTDSIYLYAYKYGRAQWKVNGAEAGKEAAERLVQRVLRDDENGMHRLDALNDLSWIMYETGDLSGCARVDSMAMGVADRSPDVPIVSRGKTRHNLGFDHSALGNYSAAAHFFIEAKKIYEQADSVPRSHMAESGNGLGAAYWHLGRNKEAEQAYKEALAWLGDDTDDIDLVSRKASTLGNLGILWQDAGDLVRSRNYYQQAMELQGRVIREAKDPMTRDEAMLNRSRSYANVATIYFAMGDMAMTRKLLDKAMADRSEVLEPDDPKLLFLLDLYADLETAMGNNERAEELERKYLASCEQRSGQWSDQTATAYLKLAGLAATRGDIEQASKLFAKSITIQERIGERDTDPILAKVLLARADMYANNKQPALALADLVQARAILSRIHGPEGRKVIQTDIDIANMQLGTDQLAAAQRTIESALTQLEGRRRPTSNGYSSGYILPHLLPSAIHQKVVIDRAMRPDHPADEADLLELDVAIAVLERNKSALQDEESKLVLYGAQRKVFDLACDIAYEAYDREHDERWKDKLFTLTEKDRSILLKSKLNEFASMSVAGVPDSVVERGAQLLKQLDIDPDDPQSLLDLPKHEAEYVDYLDRLQEEHPDYFRLKYGETTLGIADVQRDLISAEQALVAYSASKEHLYIIVIEKDRSAVTRVALAGIDTLVAALNEATIARDVQGYCTTAHQLHQRIFEPVRGLLTRSELLIVPDNELYYLNFEALLDAPSTAANFKQHLLIHDYTISYLLSASTAVQFDRLERERGRGTFAVAPGFSDALKSGYLANVRDTNLIDRAFLSHVQQPFAVLTAQSLGKLLSAQVLVGEAADEAGFKAQAENYGIIHLGTHAEVNNTSPLYSKLVLSKGVGDATNVEDGYLHAYEIFELQLRAELAVLTACETGTGKANSSEGVRSLAYSFAYAGCPSLVMSLWKIDEKSSAGIVDRFYRNLADEQAKNVALRQAKLDYLNDAQDEMALPFYWAGLVLVGDVSPVSDPDTGSSMWTWIAIGSLALVLVFFLVRRARA
jgi:CHAT domain-containing protein